MAVTQEQVNALQAQVDQLNSMLADGVRQVTLRGQTIVYNTTDSLITARDDAQERLRQATAELAASNRGRVISLFQRSRGY